jgi:restriction endonuclease S subunit
LTLSALSASGYRRGCLKPVCPCKQVEDAILKKGDFLISRSNTVELVGLVGVFDEDRADVSYPDLMMLVDVDEERIDKHYLELVLLSRKGRAHIRMVAAGTSGSMKKINRK